MLDTIYKYRQIPTWWVNPQLNWTNPTPLRNQMKQATCGEKPYENQGIPWVNWPPSLWELPARQADVAAPREEQKVWIERRMGGKHRRWEHIWTSLFKGIYTGNIKKHMSTYVYIYIYILWDFQWNFYGKMWHTFSTVEIGEDSCATCD